MYHGYSSTSVYLNKCLQVIKLTISPQAQEILCRYGQKSRNPGSTNVSYLDLLKVLILPCYGTISS